MFSRPDIFGDLSFGTQDCYGCSAIHYCFDAAWCRYAFKHMPLDCWKSLDYFGKNAIQCLLDGFDTAAVAQILLLIPKEDFIEQLTPKRFGIMGPTPNKTYVMSLLFNRFTSDIPADQQRACLVEAMHFQLRFYKSPKCMEYLNLPDQRLREICHNALFEPWTTDLTTGSLPRRVISTFNQPIPHLIALQNNGAFFHKIVAIAKRKMPDESVYRKWVLQPDEHNLDCFRYVLSTRPNAEQHKLYAQLEDFWKLHRKSRRTPTCREVVILVSLAMLLLALIISSLPSLIFLYVRHSGFKPSATNRLNRILGIM